MKGTKSRRGRREREKDGGETEGREEIGKREKKRE